MNTNATILPACLSFQPAILATLSCLPVLSSSTPLSNVSPPFPNFLPTYLTILSFMHALLPHPLSIVLILLTYPFSLSAWPTLTFPSFPIFLWPTTVPFVPSHLPFLNDDNHIFSANLYFLSLCLYFLPSHFPTYDGSPFFRVHLPVPSISQFNCLLPSYPCVSCPTDSLPTSAYLLTSLLQTCLTYSVLLTAWFIY